METNYFENLADLDFANKVTIPYIIKNATLISPGTWNNFFYSAEAIRNAYRETDWNDKKILSLFLDHLDDRTSEWVGYVRNPRMVGNKLVGDLAIFDVNTAVKMALGKPKFGVSPRVKGKADEGIMQRYIYENFSLVINPAVKTTYINNMEVKRMDFKLQEEGEEAEESELTEEPTKEEETEETSETLKKKKKDEYPEMKKKKEPEEEAMKEELSAYTKFVKAYMKKHKGEKAAKELIKDAAAAWKQKHEEIEMAEKEEQFMSAIDTMMAFLENLKKYKKYPYPGPHKYPYYYPEAGQKKKYPWQKPKKSSYPKAKMSELENELEEKNKTIEELKAKLNEPDRLSVKTGGNSELLTEYSDEAFLKFLQRQRGAEVI